MNSSQLSFDNFDFEFDSHKLAMSTPFLKSTFAQKLLKKHFLKNIHREIPMETDSCKQSTLEEKFINMKISKNSQKNRKPFVFKSQTKNSSPEYKFHVPESISIETLEKYHEIFEESPKVKRTRLRM